MPSEESTRELELLEVCTFYPGPGLSTTVAGFLLQLSVQLVQLAERLEKLAQWAETSSQAAAPTVTIWEQSLSSGTPGPWGYLGALGTFLSGLGV